MIHQPDIIFQLWKFTGNEL